ncbi:hypothetical protein GGQ26_11760 [Aeromicrobium sp. zg-629]|nr:hypothetical protein [Aeromicrobium senzhongii]
MRSASITRGITRTARVSARHAASSCAERGTTSPDPCGSTMNDDASRYLLDKATGQEGHRMNDTEAIVTTHLDTWNSPAGPERLTAIASVYAPDVVIGEPQGTLTGHEGMEQAIAALQSQVPGTELRRSGPIQVAQDLVTYPWSLGTPDGPVVASGRDVLFIRDHDVAALYVVIDTP